MKRLAVIFIFVLTTLAAAHEEAQQRSRTFTVTKGGTLEVALGGGDVRITTWEKNEVAVRGEESDDEDHEIHVTQQGNTIRVSDRGSWSGGGSIAISIPSHFHVDIATFFGDISVKGKLTGNLSAETSAGDVKLGDIEGNIDVRTSGGDIRAGKITGTGTVNTSGGEVDITSATGELDVRSSGGDIRIGNVGKALRARTAGGDVIIGDVGGEALASTAGGNVRVGKVNGQATLTTSGGDIELAGGSGVIKVSTSGGNIMLTNIAGSVDAKTSGGDVHAELVPSGKGRSRLVSAAGKILLFVPENARATITARIRIRGWWRSEKDSYAVYSDFKEESSLRSEDDHEIESRYVLNGGGEVITLETVNSDIEIRKLRK